MLKWGNTEVTAVKWGSTTCTAVYWGSTKVFPTIHGYDGSTFSAPIASGLNKNPSSETGAFGKVTTMSYGYCYIGTIDTIDWSNYSSITIKVRRVATGDYLENTLHISTAMTVTSYGGVCKGHFNSSFTGRDSTLEETIDISSVTSSSKMYFGMTNVSSSYYAADVTLTLYLLEINFK